MIWLPTKKREIRSEDTAGWIAIWQLVSPGGLHDLSLAYDQSYPIRTIVYVTSPFRLLVRIPEVCWCGWSTERAISSGTQLLKWSIDIRGVCHYRHSGALFPWGRANDWVVLGFR